jgi:hypothetical protein
LRAVRLALRSSEPKSALNLILQLYQ